MIAKFSARTYTESKSEATHQHLESQYLASQYLANKSLTFWESLCSIIATEVSALTFLGIPAFAFDHDYSFAQIYLGAILGRWMIAKFFLPSLYDQGLTVYETIAKHHSTLGGRRTLALFYLISKILSVGVRLFSGSIMVAAFFKVGVIPAIFIICTITFLYTFLGGLKTVARTDMLQMVLFVLGGIVAHIYIPQASGQSWSEMMSFAFAHGKANMINPLDPMSFLTGTVGGILFDMGTHGADHDYVQRLTANRDLKTAQKVISLSAFFSLAVGLLFLGVGSLLWVYYQKVTPPQISSDELFAYFITHQFPVGLRGLMVAGVLAATMSTLDSTINALSACLYNDIFHHRVRSLKKIKLNYLRDTLVITLLLFLVAYVSSHSRQLLILGLKIASWTGGSLLAIFFSKILWKKWLDPYLDVWAVSGAYLTGTLTIGAASAHFNIVWQWNVYLAFFTSILFLWGYAKLRKV